VVLPQQAEKRTGVSWGVFLTITVLYTIPGPFIACHPFLFCVAKQEGMVCNFMRTNYFRGQQMAKFSENCAILHGDQPCNRAGYFDFLPSSKVHIYYRVKVMNLG